MKGWVCVFAISCGDEQSATRSPDFRASHTGSLDPKLPSGSELTISLGTDITEALRRTVETELRAALAKAATCMEGIYGTSPLELEIDAAGKVTKAKAMLGPLSDSPITACIETAFTAMKIGAVQGAPLRISYPVRNMPSDQQVREASDLIKRGL
ncbi:MAG: hypothetical protein H0V17_24125 [Deltaproteobacteria bacterium]|nr:hypothetical protein [Deltaproteobacteria bacterium]